LGCKPFFGLVTCDFQVLRSGAFIMTLKHVSIALSALVVVGCAARQIEVPLNHPANPAASEAPPQPESATLKSDPVNGPQAYGDEVPIAGHAQHHREQPAALVAPYRCPMHPDVRSDKPGRCPICEMQLKKGDAQ
jgi:hypothetical protein